MKIGGTKKFLKGQFTLDAQMLCKQLQLYIVHGGQIIESNRIGMQVGVDAKCILTRVTSVSVYLCLM